MEIVANLIRFAAALILAVALAVGVGVVGTESVVADGGGECDVEADPYCHDGEGTPGPGHPCEGPMCDTNEEICCLEGIVVVVERK